MKKTTILLLCAVAFINASPYSKIPEANSQTHANLNIGNYEQSPEAIGYSSSSAVSNAYASSSANARAEANANAYAEANANAHAEANAYSNGHLNNHDHSKCQHDVNKNDKYDESSQSEYKIIPQGFHSAHYRPDNIDELSKNDREQHIFKNVDNHQDNYKQQTGSNQYWWMGNNSPFELNKKTTVECSSTGCNSNKANGLIFGTNKVEQVSLNLHGNPFLQGGSSSSTSSFNSGSYQIGTVKENYNNAKQDYSKNQFLNGGSSASASAAAAATAEASANAYQNQQISSTTAKAFGAGNPFFNNVAFGSSQASASASASAAAAAEASANAYKNQQIPSTTAKAIGAGNPFFNNAAFGSSQATASASASASASANSYSNDNSVPAFGTNNQFSNSALQVPTNTELPPYNNDDYDQQNIQTEFGLKLSCSGQGKICVAKNLCNNGYVSQNFQGLTQVRSGNQQCDVNREVCCNINNDNNDQSPASSIFGNVNLPGNNGIIYHSDQSNGLFGNPNNDQDFDFNSGDQHVSKGSRSGTLNGYLPPDGNPSNNIESFIKPTTTTTTTPPPPPPTRKPIEPAPTHLDLGGCAAALLCVESSLCGKDGFISQTRLSMSQEQLLQRVSLSSCTIPGPTKQNGVCCRDPNYTDPWPTGKLPADFDGTYDEQGFPSYLNVQKKIPPQKKNGNPIKTFFTGVQISSTTQQPPRQIYTTPQPPRQIYTTPQPPRQIYTTSTALYSTPNRIQQDYSNVYTSPKPFAPSVVPIFEKPKQIITPNYPVPSYNKVIVDEPSSTNVKLTVIPPHIPGTQCGVKNSVSQKCPCSC